MQIAEIEWNIRECQFSQFSMSFRYSFFTTLYRYYVTYYFWIFFINHWHALKIIALASRPRFHVALLEILVTKFNVQRSAAMAEVSEVVPLTLANICLDVQIGICMFIHPSDILALRKVRRHRKFSLLKSETYCYQDL